MTISISRPVGKFPTVLEVQANYDSTTDYLLSALKNLQEQLERQFESAATSKMEKLKKINVLETELSVALQELEKKSDELIELNMKLHHLTAEVFELKQADGRNAQKLQLLTIQIDALTEQIKLTEQLVELYTGKLKTAEVANELLKKEKQELEKKHKEVENVAKDRATRLWYLDPRGQRKRARAKEDSERDRAHAMLLSKATGPVSRWFVTAFFDTQKLIVGTGRIVQDLVDPKKKDPLYEI